MAEPLAQPTSPLTVGAAPDPGALPSETFDAELSPQANEWLRQQLRAGTIKRENLPVSGQVGKAERAVGKAVIAATDEPFHQVGNWLSQYQGGFAPADAGVAPLVDLAQSLPLTGAGKAAGAAALKAGAHYLPALTLGPGAALPKSAIELAPGLKIGEALEQSKGKPGLISQRWVSAKGRTPAEAAGYEAQREGPVLTVGADAMRQNPKAFETAIGLLHQNAAETGGLVSSQVINKKTGKPQLVSLLAYPLPRGLLTGASAERDAQAFMQHLTENLLFLYDHPSVAPWRERAKLWYQGANRIANERARHYGVDEASAAGVYAALSPQKDWFMNVSLGDRVLDVAHNHEHRLFDADMMATAQRIFAKPEYQNRVQRVARARYRDLDDPVDKAMWLRAFDETHNYDADYFAKTGLKVRTHQIVTPEGDFAGMKFNDDRITPSGTGWGSLVEIANAITSMESKGNRRVISEAMGEANKVRNFYNNIYDPWSPWGDTTIDTHAVGASLLLPVAGGDIPVLHNFSSSMPTGFTWEMFGTRGAPGSSVTGAQGTYGLYADSNRAAAKARNTLSREMQSVTWEAIRGLFPGEEKSSALKSQAAMLWMSGRSPAEIREMIVRLSEEGIRPPDWHGR